MKKIKKITEKIVGAMAIKSAQIANGTASLNGFCQPKEPENLSAKLHKKNK